MAHIWLIVFYPWQWPTASLTRSFPFRTIEAGVKLPSMKRHKNRFGRKGPRWGNDSQGACQMSVDINSILIQALFLLFSYIQPVWQTRVLAKMPLLLVGMTTNTSRVRCKMHVRSPSQSVVKSYRPVPDFQWTYCLHLQSWSDATRLTVTWNLRLIVNNIQKEIPFDKHY
jgi:hypothetical protein